MTDRDIRAKILEDICSRGFEYKYRMSSQGVKYVRWLQGVKMTEDFAYAKLTSEVLSYLPDELKNKLSMLSLAKAARRYSGPSRNMNLLDSNAVPVIHLSAERMRLRSENSKLKLDNAIQQVTLTSTLGARSNSLLVFHVLPPLLIETEGFLSGRIFSF